MKKQILGLIIVMLILTACSKQSTNIKVYTRDGASGAREAFSSIIELEQMSINAAETSNNGDMAKQVGSTKNGIGYVSLSTDLEANHLKALKYEGVEPSISTVYNNEYKLARPFSYVTRAAGDYGSERKEALIRAFIDYMTLSTEGMEVLISAGGIANIEESVGWNTLVEKHPIVNEYNADITIRTGGSTSVAGTLDALMASFIPMAGNFKYEPNQTGSSDGYKRTLGSEKDSINKVDIGFASREFKSDEDLSGAMDSGVYCLDAVVVVVHDTNESIDDANADLLRDIFSGVKETW